MHKLPWQAINADISTTPVRTLSMNHPNLSISVAATVDDVSRLGAMVNALAKTVLADTDAFQVELAVVEVCNNVVEHAYQYAPDKHFSVDITFDAASVMFEIRDAGASFSYNPAAPAVLNFDPDNLETPPEGGMGLFLVEQIMTNISYTTENGINTFSMTKILPLAEDRAP